MSRRVPAGRRPEGIERRIRRGITLVAAAAVLMTALPLLALSIAGDVMREARKARLVVTLIERDVRQQVEAYAAEIVGLAAMPNLSAGLVGSPLAGPPSRDTRGNHGQPTNHGDFLRQRAVATGSRLRLFDEQGRPLLDTAAGEAPADPAPEGTAEARSAAPRDGVAHVPPPATLPAATTTLLRADMLVVTAPIRSFTDQRVVGWLEGRLPLRRLVADAADGLAADYHLAMLRDDLPVFSTEGAPRGGGVPAMPGPPHSGDPAGDATTRPLALPGEAEAMRIALWPRRGWVAAITGWVVPVMLGAILGALLLALLAARRIARVLTAPIGALVQASARFRAGEVPGLEGLREVREIGLLAEAMAAAFQARDAAQAEAVRQAERMLEGLPVAVFRARVDAAGDFVLDYLSPGITRMAGWPPEALHRSADWAALTMPAVGPGFLQGLSGQAEGSSEFRLRCADGRWIWLRERSRTIRRGEAEAEVVGTLIDVSTERTMQAQAVATGKLALLGEMATGLAHELSQPLAVMSLAAENASRALRSKGVEAIGGALERLERIIAQAVRARGIVDHLRIFARREEPAALEAVALPLALEGALTLIGGPLRAAGIQVQVELPPGLPAVRAALIPMEQILVNLLINARDALGDPAPEAARIAISAAVRDGRVELRLRDNGPGIPPTVVERIFEPFFTTKEAGKGTGLGLSICHGTMRSFGGAIEAVNLPEGGAEFRLGFLVAEPALRLREPLSAGTV